LTKCTNVCRSFKTFLPCGSNTFAFNWRKTGATALLFIIYECILQVVGPDPGFGLSLQQSHNFVQGSSNRSEFAFHCVHSLPKIRYIVGVWGRHHLHNAGSSEQRTPQNHEDYHTSTGGDSVAVERDPLRKRNTAFFCLGKDSFFRFLLRFFNAFASSCYASGPNGVEKTFVNWCSWKNNKSKCIRNFLKQLAQFLWGYKTYFLQSFLLEFSPSKMCSF